MSDERIMVVVGYRALSLVMLGACRLGFDPLVADGADATADDAPPDAIPCVGGAQRVTVKGHCYVLYEVSSNITWMDAKTACETASGHLVTYASPEEESAVISVLAPIERVWIGLNDIAVEDTWVWVTGEPFTYMNWRGVEPNGGTNENCGAHSAAVTVWLWNDLDCGGGASMTFGYICENGG